MPDSTQVRLGAAALGVGGLPFLLHPALRPWHDESGLVGAETSMSSGAWVAAHPFARVPVPRAVLVEVGAGHE